MKLIDSVARVMVRAQGSGPRWLRQELDTLRVRIPLTDGCLAEFAREADEAAAGADCAGSAPYVERLRQQLADSARFIQRWTGSDEAISAGEAEQAHVRIARQYALPRPWKLSEPVAVEYPRTRPSYWHWTDDLESDAA
ncbi:MAG TPA: hypothetical protein VLX90_04790 [Steroidobacteraceae bacterium]|nr:hypothetical protein [Steroidobacteraceae bacterium]